MKDRENEKLLTLVDDQVMLDALTRTLRFTPDFNDLISLNVTLNGVDAEFVIGHKFIKTNRSGFDLLEDVVNEFYEIRKAMLEEEKASKKAKK